MLVQGHLRPPALHHLVQRLADNKYWLGRRYAEWCTAAPTLESAVAAAAMAQDEIGHARSLYPLLRQFVGHDVEPENIAQFHSMSFLDQPFSHWTDFVAANFVVDSALSVVLRSATESTYDDLKTRARRIIGEEDVHWLHGRGWVRRLALGGTELRAALQASLNRVWPETLMWFGPSDNGEMDELRRTEVVRHSPNELRRDLLGRVGPILIECDLELDSAPNPSQSAALRWAEWDAARFRLSSRPSDLSV